MEAPTPSLETPLVRLTSTSFSAKQRKEFLLCVPPGPGHGSWTLGSCTGDFEMYRSQVSSGRFRFRKSGRSLGGWGLPLERSPKDSQGPGSQDSATSSKFHGLRGTP